VAFTIAESKITAIDLIDEPHRIAEADLAIVRAKDKASVPSGA
jgi:hypothetical protein